MTKFTLASFPLLASSLLAAVLFAPKLPRSRDIQKVADDGWAEFDSLPACSNLGEDFENGNRGDGKDLPYMAAMRQVGVHRAVFVLSATYPALGTTPKVVTVEHRVYFSQLDGPAGSITDSNALARIRDSGVQAQLDKIAIGLGRQARLYVGVDNPPADLEIARNIPAAATTVFFSNAMVPKPGVVFEPLVRERLTDLESASETGDRARLEAIIHEQHPDRAHLEDALEHSVVSQYDNSAVIRMLVQAGGNVNDLSPKDGLPLLLSVASPCSELALIRMGENPEARSRSGEPLLSLALRLQRGRNRYLITLQGAVAALEAPRAGH